jgi:hypothetical protein
MALNTARDSRGRAISDHEPATILHTSPGSAIAIKVLEAQLQLDVAKLGSMKPFVKVTYGNVSWRTDISTGMKPKWNTTHVFESCDSDTVEVVVYHKNMLFGETEVGKCVLNLSEVARRHLTEWWSLSTFNGDLAGSILLSFDLDGDRRFTDTSFMGIHTTHSTNNSVDARDDLPKYTEPTTKLQDSTYYRRKKIRRMRKRYEEPPQTDPKEDYIDLEKLKNELLEENERIKTQEDKVKKLFEKLRLESNKLKQDKEEVKKSKLTLRRREECILAEKKIIEEEKEKVRKEREQLEKLKDQLNSDYYRLRQEKLRMQAHKKLIEITSKQVFDKSRQLDKQRLHLHKRHQEEDSSMNGVDIQKKWEEIDQVRELLDKEHKNLAFQMDSVQIQKLALEEERAELTARKLEIMKKMGKDPGSVDNTKSGVAS